MRTMMSSAFLLMVIFGIIAVPIYLATMLAIIKVKTRKSSFFRIYLIVGIINIVAYLNRYIVIRLPLFTCGSCFFAKYFWYTSYWWILPSLFIHWQVMHLQFIFSSVIAFDRYVVIVLGGRMTELWDRFHHYLIIFLLLLPLSVTWILFTGRTNYEYLQPTDNFRIGTTANLPFQYDCLLVVEAATVIISTFLNFSVLVYFCLGKIYVQGQQRATEMKLFLNSVADLTVQVASMALTFSQRLFFTTDPQGYDESRVFVLFAIDIMALLPPFVLLITCQQIRAWMFPCIRRKTTKEMSETKSAGRANSIGPTI